jgi:hypothetical protein
METQISDSGLDSQSEPTLVISGHHESPSAPEPSTAPTVTVESVSPPADAAPTRVSEIVEPPPASFEAPPPPPAPPAAAKSGGSNRTWLIVAIVVLVLCCCCCGLATVIAALATEGFQDWSSVLWGIVPLA